MTFWLCSQLAAWVFLLLVPAFSDGGKLLVVPTDGSHWLSMSQVVEKLTERGHEVVVIIPEVNWRMGKTPDYTVKTYAVPYTLEELNNAFHEYYMSHLEGLPFPQNVVAQYRSGMTIFSTLFSQCKGLFGNKEMVQYLNQSKFDAILTDPVTMCGTVVANYISAPSIFFMRGFPCGLHYTANQCPNPVSYVPRLFTFNSDRMTFFERVENTLVAILELGYCEDIYSQVVRFTSELLQRDVTLLELLSSASIWLLRFDYVFEYVRPVMPNMIFIGGINCAERKPLSKVYSFSLDYTHEMQLHVLWRFGAVGSFFLMI